MQGLLVLAFSALAFAAPATTTTSASDTASTVTNTTQQYYLKTQLKPCSSDKTKFDDLFLLPYHIGAGENDATFSSNGTYAAVGFLNGTGTTAAGNTINNQIITLGPSPYDYPYSLDLLLSVVEYSAWQPTRINIGTSAANYGNSSSYFINGTGLQWTSNIDAPSVNDEFGGWLVCNWWHSVPQLFFRISYYNEAAIVPESCADVDLIPHYI